MEISGPPEEPILPVWRNELGGLTFQLGEGESRRFVKWSPAGSGLPPLAEEARRLDWAGRYIAVPTVLATGEDADGSWLLTAGLPGDSAVSERFHADDDAARVAARAIGAGLRAMHDSLPVDDCPFSWSVSDRIATARRSGTAVPAGLEEAPPIDRLVVCHGDPCAPNTLVSSDGEFAGHVDLGTLGVADRWADLAVATWSLEWNFGDGFDADLLDAYGIEPELERIAYYRRLWDAT